MVDVVFFQPISGFYDRVSKQLPLGLLYASSYLYKEGYSVKIIDQAVDSNWKLHLKNELIKKPLFLGITCKTGGQILNALRGSKIANEYEIPVIWGGPHPTLLPKQTLQNKYVDIVVIGEGEKTTYELAKTIEKEKSLKNVRGIAYKDKKQKIHINREREVVDLDTLPSPPITLLNYKKYSTFTSKRIFNLESSRGCPFNCAFCYVPSLKRERNWRAMSPKRTVDLIKLFVEKYGIDGVDFVDYNFFVDIKRVKEIIKLLFKEKLNIEWNSESLRIDIVSKMPHQLISELERSGLRFVALGIESGSERILKLINKGITIKEAISVNKKLSRYKFITPQYNFMIGIPSETTEDWRKTTDLMLKLKSDNSNAYMQPLSPYLPYPGTKLFEVACDYGFSFPQKLEEWIGIDYPFWFSKVPWLNKKEKKIMKTLYIASLFIDNKARSRLYGSTFSKIIKNFSYLYKPIAKFRLKRHFTSFVFEGELLNLLQ
jgi:radical SAM superfamily enzyme YgiQ (UPF0313 family)